MLFTPHHCDMGRAGHLLQLNCMSWKYSPRFMMATQLEHSTIEGSEGGGGRRAGRRSGRGGGGPGERGGESGENGSGRGGWEDERKRKKKRNGGLIR